MQAELHASAVTLGPSYNNVQMLEKMMNSNLQSLELASV